MHLIFYFKAHTQVSDIHILKSLLCIPFINLTIIIIELLRWLIKAMLEKKFILFPQYNTFVSCSHNILYYCLKSLVAFSV